MIARYLATDRIRRLNLDIEALKNTLFEQGDNYLSFYLALMQFYANSVGKIRYGEKTPHNAYYADQLCELFPNGRLIHIVRDPRDVVASLLRMPWGSDSALSNLRVWRDCSRIANFCQRNDSYLLVLYENLVRQPEHELKRICDFINEEYSATMLENATNNKTDKWWFQRAQQPLTKNRIDTWKDDLSAEDVALIERMVGVQMETFGYQFDRPSTTVPNMMRNLVSNYWVIFREKIQQLPRMWYFWFQPTQLAKEEDWIDNRSRKNRSPLPE